MTETKEKPDTNASNVTDISLGASDNLMQRNLSNRDISKVIQLISNSLGDERLPRLLEGANMQQAGFALAGVFLANSQRDFELLCADFVGINKKYDLGEYEREAKDKARADAEDDAEYLDNPNIKGQWRVYMPSDGEIQAKMNDAILEEYGEMEPDTLPRLLGEVMDDPNFPKLRSSVTAFIEKVQSSFGNEQTSSDKKSAGSRKKKS